MHTSVIYHLAYDLTVQSHFSSTDTRLHRRIYVLIHTQVFKQFFLELPEPLFTWELYDDIASLASDPMASQIEKDQALKKYLARAPAANRSFIAFLLNVLGTVAMYFNENKMTPKNLAIVFAPSLFSPKVFLFLIFFFLFCSFLSFFITFISPLLFLIVYLNISKEQFICFKSISYLLVSFPLFVCFLV